MHLFNSVHFYKKKYIKLLRLLLNYLCHWIKSLVYKILQFEIYKQKKQI